MALTMDECEEMVNTSEENYVILQIGYMMRFHPIHQYVKKEISKGNLGQVQYAHAERTIFFDYASQELPEYRKWYLDKTKSGGGAFMDLGSHVLDLILYLVNDDVDRINFEANLDPKLGIDQSGLGTLKFKGGAVASIFAGWQTPLHDNVLKIYGDKAALYAVRSIGPYKDGRLELITSDNRKGIDIPYENHYVLELKHFRDCVVKGTSCITSGKNCLQTERIRINMYNLI
jgi:predicted dehydrogenase